MKRIVTLVFGAAFLFSSTAAVFAVNHDFGKVVKSTDIPYIPSDDDSGPYTDPEPTPDPGPDSTDSGDSWDNGSSGGGYDGGDVLF
jgi:hypothetical protein